jgi:hypothetical protein
VLASIDPIWGRRLAGIFAKDLPDVGVLYIGQLSGENEFSGRILKLVEDAAGPRFKPAAAAKAILD